MSPTGHLAIGFAAKKYTHDISLPILLIAAYTIDLLYFVFIALKMESYAFNPWSHSLGMAIIWSGLGALIFYLFKHNKKQALIIGLLVFSHWILDFIVWDNLPIFFDSTQRIGLGLYPRIGFSMSQIQLNLGSILATSLELLMLVVGLVLYFRNRRKV
ncbi:MAG TPA: hypothetical protein DIC19_03080 [Erysipelotrichaceae bacterium]|nr:hypothetical protein [Erysipelotrichaceae bacterium]